MSDDIVQAVLFVATGSIMAVVGTIKLKRLFRATRRDATRRFEAKAAFFLLFVVVGLLLVIFGLGMLSLMGSTDL